MLGRPARLQLHRLSPKDGAELAIIKSFTRDRMGEVERDLGAELDWVAVEHWNTAL